MPDLYLQMSNLKNAITISGQMVFNPISVREISQNFPDSKVHGAHMRPTWVLSAQGGPHVGPIEFAIWVDIEFLDFLAHLPTVPPKPWHSTSTCHLQPLQQLVRISAHAVWLLCYIRVQGDIGRSHGETMCSLVKWRSRGSWSSSWQTEMKMNLFHHKSIANEKAIHLIILIRTLMARIICPREIWK